GGHWRGGGAGGGGARRKGGACGALWRGAGAERARSRAMNAVAAADTVDLAMPVVGSLSPSRAADFKACPLLYRFRAVDKLPQRPSPDAVRGTVVHAVLEQLFGLPRAQRTYAAAAAMVEPRWRDLLEAFPDCAELFVGDENGSVLAGWLESARALLASYFALEDPNRIEPAAREELVEAVLPDGLLLRGYVDR